MFRRRTTYSTLLLAMATVIGILFGPISHLGALPTFDNKCGDACPCESSDSENGEAAEQGLTTINETCPDDCQECACDSALSSALAPSKLDFRQPRMVEYVPIVLTSLTPRLGDDIFVPPIA